MKRENGHCALIRHSELRTKLSGAALIVRANLEKKAVRTMGTALGTQGPLFVVGCGGVSKRVNKGTRNGGGFLRRKGTRTLASNSFRRTLTVVERSMRGDGGPGVGSSLF